MCYNVFIRVLREMKATMSQSKPFSVRLADEVKTDVDRLAELTNRSRSYVINEAARRYAAERLAYLKELDEAIESIDTKPTYASEDVIAWMQTWGTEDEKPLSEANIPAQK